MIYNATISSWRQRSGHDAEGAITYAAQPGSWPCCSEHGGRRVVFDPQNRAIPVERVLRTDQVFTIEAGDMVSVEGEDYVVLQSSVQPGALAHLLLHLGSA